MLLDEVRVPSASWSLAPRHVSVALTNACELSCPYCYAPKKPASLNFERLAHWLTELDSNGCLGIGFGGGEPTLHRRFADVCRFAAHETGLGVSFTTHGHNLNEGLLAALKGNVHFVRVSMDGVGTTYEELRGRSFQVLLQRIELLSELAPFGINFVVNGRTFDDLDSAIDLAARLGASEFLLLPEQTVNGRGGIDSITMRSLRRWIDGYQGTVPLTTSEAGAGGLDMADPLSQESGLRSYIHVDAWGVLKRSSYDDAGLPIGPQGIMRALEILELRQGDDRN